MIIAVVPNWAVSPVLNFVIDSPIKLNPTIASRVAIIIAAIDSARPCPNGCSLSGGMAAILKPRITIIEVSESERVCQESAIMATD